jgi:hypothetical protein
MKKKFIFTLLISIFGISPAFGNDFRIDHQFQPATGDWEFDDLLRNMNRAAGDTISDYIADLSASFNMPGKKVASLIYGEKMQPADVFMLLQTMRISGCPYDKLMKRFKLRGQEGWGAVVLSLGIKPGSKVFILLEEDIPPAVQNYATRWREGAKRKKVSKKKEGRVMYDT